jgi:hypothetical protein
MGSLLPNVFERRSPIRVRASASTNSSFPSSKQKEALHLVRKDTNRRREKDALRVCHGSPGLQVATSGNSVLGTALIADDELIVLDGQLIRFKHNVVNLERGAKRRSR